jgi:hypothetical protein
MLVYLRVFEKSRLCYFSIFLRILPIYRSLFFVIHLLYGRLEAGMYIS